MNLKGKGKNPARQWDLGEGFAACMGETKCEQHGSSKAFVRACWLSSGATGRLHCSGFASSDLMGPQPPNSTPRSQPPPLRCSTPNPSILCLLYIAFTFQRQHSSAAWHQEPLGPIFLSPLSSPASGTLPGQQLSQTRGPLRESSTKGL